ncbi:MAG: tetratricopeptide repeat protein [Dehalococcoidales bacterium]
MRGGTDGSPKGRRPETSRSITRKQRTTETSEDTNNRNNNNVYINNNVNASYPTPYGAGRRHTRLRYSSFGHNSHWYDHGGYFTLGWSRHSYGRVVSFGYGPYGYYGVSYYYPGYHRRYIFCSLGGYWPSYYRYRRYYWYGCHPYRWYGSYVIDQPVVYDTYNTYNTYNTYTTDAQYSTQTAYPAGGYDDFSDVREKLRQEAAAQTEDSPAAETTADICFDQAVELFAQGKYEQAVFKLRVAMVLDPEDVILPFAYSQTLFASGDYDSAAAVLRRTLENQPEDEAQQTVYYPRGLYQDEKVLHQQIDQLAEKAGLEADNADYQLLLGYQLLGAGRLDEAITPLHKALDMDIANSPSMILIKLLEKIKADEAAAAAAPAATAVEISPEDTEKTVQPPASEAAKKDDD